MFRQRWLFGSVQLGSNATFYRSLFYQLQFHSIAEHPGQDGVDIPSSSFAEVFRFHLSMKRDDRCEFDFAKRHPPKVGDDVPLHEATLRGLRRILLMVGHILCPLICCRAPPNLLERRSRRHGINFTNYAVLGVITVYNNYQQQ